MRTYTCDNHCVWQAVCFEIVELKNVCISRIDLIVLRIHSIVMIINSIVIKIDLIGIKSYSICATFDSIVHEST